MQGVHEGVCVDIYIPIYNIYNIYLSQVQENRGNPPCLAVRAAVSAALFSAASTNASTGPGHFSLLDWGHG